jgi:hypothetical protein
MVLPPRDAGVRADPARTAVFRRGIALPQRVGAADRTALWPLMSSHVPSTGTEFSSIRRAAREHAGLLRAAEHRSRSSLVARALAGPNSSTGSGRRPVARVAGCTSSAEARPRISSVPHRGPSRRRAQLLGGAPRASHAGIESRSAAGRPLPHAGLVRHRLTARAAGGRSRCVCA